MKFRKQHLALFATGFIFWISGSHHAFAAFQFERSITIDHTKVPNTDQANFPVGVASTTYSFLATAANGGKVQNSQGFDVGFYTNSNCSTGKMAWEVDTYNPTTGSVAYWVSNATVSHTSDTVFYMCYDNPSITTDQSATTTVWSNAGNYIGVYHLGGVGTGSAGDYKDSTGNSNNSTNTTNQPSSATGLVGGAQNFTQSTVNFIQFPRLLTAAGFTVSMLIKPTTSGGDFIGNGLFYQAPLDTSTPGTALLIINASGSGIANGVDGINGNVQLFGANDAITLNTWQLLSFTVDASGNSVIYVNGSPVLSGSTSSAAPTNNPAYLGLWFASNDTTRQFSGLMDEARISSSVRSPDWITTEANNELLPDKAGGATGFYTLGAETAVSGGGTTTHGPRFYFSLGKIKLLFGKWIIK